MLSWGIQSFASGRLNSIMKTQTQSQRTLASLMLLSTLLLQPARVFGQGGLTPPGAPAPTMKSLAQVEPRTAITNSGAVTISVPGSYYLTTNITVSAGDAITIATNNVTLDLSGFTISSTAASAEGAAIRLSGARTNISIYNGHVSSGVTNNNAGVYGGSGFGYGIISTLTYNLRVKEVSVGGVLYHGIDTGIGNSSVTAGCTVAGAGGYGIFTDKVSESSAFNCGGYAIYAYAAQDCVGQSVGSGSLGISASTALNCYGISTGANGYGIYAYMALNCYGAGTGTNGSGLYGYSAQNCFGSANGAATAAVYATMALNCFGNGNNNAYGVLATVAQGCYGSSNGNGDGIHADNVQNCNGYSGGTGRGVYATDTAIGSSGYSGSGTGLFAYIANSCRGNTTSGTAQSISYKYNMP